MTGIVLENGALRLTLRPESGGKLSSLVSLAAGEELLAQPPAGHARPLEPGMSFAAGEAAGFDDVFPSMGEDACPGAWPAVPDHGLVWTRAMDARQEGNAVCLSLRSAPWRYEKRVLLEGNAVRMDWRIRNEGDAPACFAWVCHGLWRLEEGMRFFFPEGEAMDVMSPDEPTAVLPERPIAPGTMAKLYLRQPVREGRCGFAWPEKNLRMTMTFDPAQLPYLGFWITNGGWRGDRNFAFEPANALYDTMERARRSGTLNVLAPGGEKRFGLTLTVDGGRP